MRLTTFSCVFLFTCFGAARAADGEADQYEEKYVAYAADRVAREGRTDRARWVKELEAAYPGKVADPKRSEEYVAWFDLLTGGRDEWSKPGAANPKFAELYGKVADKLRLGPVPAIKRDEFSRYAKYVLAREQPRDDQEEKRDEYADKVFRVLDRNADGELSDGELTAALKGKKSAADADSNGRISKDEYLVSFRAMVDAKVQSLAAEREREAARRAEGDGNRPAPGDEAGLPQWFTALDADKDDQVSLFEWRNSRQPIAAFQEMDLDGDGLLLQDEYERHVKLKQIEADQKRREELFP